MRKNDTMARFGNLTELASGSWRARYTHRRKVYYKTFKRESHANRWLEEERKLILFGDWTPPKERDKQKAIAALTVADFFDTLAIKRKWADTTKAGYQNMFDKDIAPALGDKPLQSVTRADVRTWYDTMAKAHRKRAKRNRDCYCLLSTLFNQAVRDELLDVSPVDIPEASTRPPTENPAEIPEPEEFATLVTTVPDRYKAPTVIAAGCALRIGEWSELRRKDLVRDGDVWKLHIRRQVQESDGGSKKVVPYTKTKQSRWVTIPAGCIPVLEQHLGKYVAPGRDALLFPNRDGDWVDRRRFNRMLKAACDAALGHTNISSHTLRHYGGTMFARAGGSLVETMARLGHSTTSAALRYQHASQSRDVEVANKIVMPLVVIDGVA